MKYRMLLPLAFALALPDYALAQAVDLTGNWKEVRRIPRGGSAEAFTDTTFYDFMIGNEYTTQRRSSYMYRGTYKATSGILDLGMRAYNILERSPSRMLLKDDAGTYEFVRYVRAATKEDNSAASSSGRAYKEGAGTGEVTASMLEGKWEAYKRTSSSTMPEVDHSRVIRMIEIRSAGRRVSGGVYAARDLQDAPSWKISRYAGNVLYCSGEDERQLKVLSYADGELIMKEDNITYFFKQFK